MWISQKNRKYHPLTKVLGLTLISLAIILSNSYVLLFILHLYLWKTFEKKDRLTQFTTIFAIFLDFFHIFCGKVSFFTKFLGLCVSFLDFFHSLSEDDNRYYYEKIGYKKRNTLNLFLLLTYGKKEWKKAWNHLETTRKEMKIERTWRNVLLQLNITREEQRKALRKLKVVYCLRSYQRYLKRTTLEKIPWTKDDTLYVFTTCSIFILALITK